MSQFPQRVLTDIVVTWDKHANGVPVTTFVRHGTVVDLVPGSALAAAYASQGSLPAAQFGGLLALQTAPPVLSGVIPLSQRGNEACCSRAAVAN